LNEFLCVYFEPKVVMYKYKKRRHKSASSSPNLGGQQHRKDKKKNIDKISIRNIYPYHSSSWSMGVDNV